MPSLFPAGQGAGIYSDKASCFFLGQTETYPAIPDSIGKRVCLRTGIVSKERNDLGNEPYFRLVALPLPVVDG